MTTTRPAGHPAPTAVPASPTTEPTAAADAESPAPADDEGPVPAEDEGAGPGAEEDRSAGPTEGATAPEGEGSAPESTRAGSAEPTAEAEPVAGVKPVVGAEPIVGPELVVGVEPAAADSVLPTAEASWAIDATDLVKSYRGRRRADPPVRAVRGVSLRVGTGTIFGLLGPNGAGKSTTVRMLATLTRPDSGSATVAGHDLLRSPWEVRRSIGIVPQRSGADPDATGRENLLLQGRLYGLGGAALDRRADELLDRFGLAEAASRLARTYSGGMLRRLDVAIGLVARPAVLFLDEPTTGLDPQARAVMWAEIEALTADGLSILLTTHYLEEADRLASRVAIIENGEVVVEGTPDELKSELHGDAVDLELTTTPDAGQAEALRGRLAALAGVGEVTLTGRAVRARVDGGAGILPALFAAVDGVGLATAAATVARPSLDDVYLRHVGHRFGRQEEVA
jgi:ABC-2 type transport system ATP-binding protein